MPIKFACENCNQKLSVSSTKAGARAKCPKCGEQIEVPQPDQNAPADVPAEQGPGDGQQMDPFARFAVFDEETEWVYESGDEDHFAAEVEASKIDYDRVAVPRNVIYMQGGLLGVVAVFCFLIGLTIGRISAPIRIVDTGPQPCTISGRVEYVDDSNEVSPDVGSVVIVVPVGSRPELSGKINQQNIRPNAETISSGRTALQQFGGDLAKVDQQGNYSVNVPNRGSYFVLVVSHNKESSGSNHTNEQLAQMGDYFEDPANLLATYNCHWEQRTFKHDTPALNFDF
ncbi:MAG: phage FluMu protein Com [Pirellulaceae bacterium]|jgi:phage FluMu protein Com